jgi:hypothetical protein
MVDHGDQVRALPNESRHSVSWKMNSAEYVEVYQVHMSVGWISRQEIFQVVIIPLYQAKETTETPLHQD